MAVAEDIRRSARALMDTHGGFAIAIAAEQAREAVGEGDPASVARAREIHGFLKSVDRRRRYLAAGHAAILALPLGILATVAWWFWRGQAIGASGADVALVHGFMYFIIWFSIWFLRVVFQALDTLPMIAGVAVLVWGIGIFGGQVGEYRVSGHWPDRSVGAVIGPAEAAATATPPQQGELAPQIKAFWDAAMKMPISILFVLFGGALALWGRDFMVERQIARLLAERKLI